MSGYLVDLGRMEYGSALAIQKEMAAGRARKEIPDTLVLVEHDPVITLGRKTSPANLKEQTIPVFQVERGGDATFHGPGQLVGYPIFFLEDHDVRRHVRGIEEAIIQTVKKYGIEGTRVEGHPGIWVDGKKLASIGVAVTDWVTYHGFALNVSTDLSYFELIRPCGLDPATMTSMEKVTGRPMHLAEVEGQFVREYSKTTGKAFSHRRLVTSA